MVVHIYFLISLKYSIRANNTGRQSKFSSSRVIDWTKADVQSILASRRWYLSPCGKKNVSSKYLPCLIVYGYTNNTRGTSIHHDSLPAIITKQTDKRTSSSFFAFSPVRARELSNNVVAWQWRTFVEWPPREREKETHTHIYIYICRRIAVTYKDAFRLCASTCCLFFQSLLPSSNLVEKKRGRKGKGDKTTGEEEAEIVEKEERKKEREKGKMENIAVDMESRVTGFLIGMDDCPTSSD